ncbi:hypothetical protein [Ulvibacter litoralis]|uniref:hypothetical protein n=1 Tax=Ulvibacter litoralis TaxID=227084 RepID=UPI000B809520|nr:hypothetical protein [Ulvibacter litoralis]
MLKYLGVSDFGLYNVVASIVVMMNFLNVVMISTTYRYIAFELGKEKNVKGVNLIFNLSSVIHITMAILVWIIGETVGVYYIHNYLNIESTNIGVAIFVFRMSILATIINVVSIPYQGLIVAHENFYFQSIVEIIKNVVNFSFVLFLSYYLGNRLKLYSFLIVLSTIGTTLMYIVYCKKHYGEQIKWNFQRKFSQYKELLGYSGWMMIGAGAEMGKNSLLPVVLNFFYGTLLNAAFGIANQLNRFLILFSGSLGQAAIPQITKSYSGNDDTRILMLVSYISKYSFLLMYLLAFPILLQIDFLLNLWVGEVPQYTVIFCQLMIVNALIESLKAGIPAAVQATGKVRWFMLINSTIKILGLPLSYFLLKYGYKPYIVFQVYIIISLITLVISIFLLHRIINFNVISLLKTSYLKLFYVCVLTLPLYFVNSHIESINYGLIFSFIGTPILYLSTIYFVGLDQKEKSLAKRLLVKLKEKIK